MTGVRLAESLSWPQSKVSKLETARQTPTEQDLREWAQATGSESRTDELLVALRTLEAKYAEWQRLLSKGHGPVQRRTLELDAKTRLFRVFEDVVIPGLLQTAEYARAMFEEGVLLHGVLDNIDEAVQARMKRQELLYRKDKRFHLVVTEAALRVRQVDRAAMLAQLDRLVLLSTLPNVRLGIIDFDTRFVIGPQHGFWLRDSKQVDVETYSAALCLTQPAEVELYGKVFEHFASIASYDRAAREIITRVADELVAKMSSEDE